MIGMQVMTSEQDQLTDRRHSLHKLWEHLLNSMHEFAFFAQDAAGNYQFASRSFLALLGRSPSSVIGRHASQIVPEPVALVLNRTHRWVIQRERSLTDELVPLHLDGSHSRWYLLSNYPFFLISGEIVYVVGYLRALTPSRDTERQLPNIAMALQYFRDNVSALHTLSSLAEQAEVSPYQFERRVKRVFGVSTRDYMIKVRMQLGRDLLKKSGLDILAISKECGYADQSSFTRQFRLTTGLPPGEFRKSEYSTSRSDD